MKLIHFFSRLLIGLALLLCLLSYKNLIQNELNVADNDGNITLVAKELQQYIEGIQINGRYLKTEEVIKNEWYTVNHDVVNNFYISQIEDNVIEIHSSTPVKTLNFEYRISDETKYIKIYNDNQLIDIINTSVGTKYTNLAHIQLKQEEKLTSENAIWYVQLVLYFSGILFFIFNPNSLKIRFKTIFILLVLIALGHILIELLIPFLYREKLVLFNSEFTKNQLKNLVSNFILLTAVTLFSFNKQKNWLAKVLKRILSPACFYLSPLLALYLIENSYSQTGNISPEFLKTNLLILYIIYLILVLLSNSKIAAILIIFFSTGIGVINKILIDVRETPLLFHNIFQFQDGLNVASNFRITFINRTVTSSIIGFLAIVIIYYFPKKRFVFKKYLFPPFLQTSFFQLSKIFLGIALTLVLIPNYIIDVVKNKDIPLNYWIMQATYADYGLPLSLLSFYEDALIEVPNNYSHSQIENILKPYQRKENSLSTSPNIVFIQSESQVDFSNLSGILLEPDPLSFQHSLTNSIQGKLNVSVYGGGTANTEYEVLTSHSISLLSPNMIPYQQLITTERTNFTSYLFNLGYQSIALHPQSGTNYNRKVVYPLLGFDQTYFTNSSPSIATLAEMSHDRAWPSDRFLLEGVKYLYESKSDEPLFSFVVTMQGHGGYTTSEEDYQREVSINGSTSEFLSETEFLTSIKKSDEAFKDLVDFFQNFPEPTIIVMWGDHQPTLSQGFYDRFFSIEDPAAKYTTPFVIWSNFPLPNRENVTISPNYLVPYMLQILSETDYALPITPYYQFLSELQQTIPVLTTWGYKTSDNSPINSPENQELLNSYQILEYNRAVDKTTLYKYFE